MKQRTPVAVRGTAAKMIGWSGLHDFVLDGARFWTEHHGSVHDGARFYLQACTQILTEHLTCASNTEPVEISE